MIHRQTRTEGSQPLHRPMCVSRFCIYLNFAWESEIPMRNPDWQGKTYLHLQIFFAYAECGIHKSLITTPTGRIPSMFFAGALNSQTAVGEMFISVCMTQEAYR